VGQRCSDTASNHPKLDLPPDCAHARLRLLKAGERGKRRSERPVLVNVRAQWQAHPHVQPTRSQSIVTLTGTGDRWNMAHSSSGMLPLRRFE
jgi:hypothetical protein